MQTEYATKQYEFEGIGRQRVMAARAAENLVIQAELRASTAVLSTLEFSAASAP